MKPGPDGHFESTGPATVTLLVNPFSRHGTGRRVGDEAEEVFRRNGIDVKKLVGANADEAARMAADAAADANDALVVVGGDGTVRLAVQAAYGTGKPLAIIPAGSGNDVARNLGIPVDDVAGAVAAAIHGHRRTIDIGRLTFPDGRSELFTTIAATGFDAEVTARAIDMRWPRGQSRYTIAALRELIRLRSRHYQVRVDDEQFEHDLVFAAIGNTNSYGGGMLITPAADVSDGLLDITLAVRPSRFARMTLARVFPKVFTGAHVHHPMVHTLRGREIELYCDPPARVSVDGDLVGLLPITIDVLPASMDFFVPAGADPGRTPTT
ncbi:YegS/Rv2252/BmrU family lipid kinase [Gordonia sp. ABSL1-1]|uniref:diacylglycerol/lipid kinase family protein n=1 Tax=Gordonia sp. ABSL1-1 TaxID=3053923 RepID=UPI0025732943|nr:YegS/Rv2252/BmrU family lipid kinase [Gordonia sp. ABSL1-1]MDL9936596.1 YegS/Rv2252/BmrU family lipid kinase [Gordonia sp. ABSL1-1]